METPDPRTTVTRKPDRARYDRATIDAILDEALICHVGIARADGPVVIPTIHARDGDALYVHGSPVAGWLRLARDGAPVCVTATIVDALVLARSIFNHSLNYRSVVVLGPAREVTDRDEKVRASRALSDHVLRGRWDEARQPTPKELAATMILRVALDEASAKIRTGPPVDDEADHALPIWAGEVPLRTTLGEPVADPALRAGIEPPASVAAREGRWAPG